MKVLDTTVIVDITRKNISEEKSLKLLESSAITEHTVYELLIGLYSAQEIPAERVLKLVKFLDRISVLQFSRGASIKSAEICGLLKKTGQEIEDIDCLIAGTALANGITTIVTRNKNHFKKIPGLKVETY
ncbi:MAG: type II toxin-antitoxin system VapC family toxin [Candidatus Woesearchaeota archaeon]